MVSDAEVEKVITFWQQLHPAESNPAALGAAAGGGSW